MAQRSMSTVSGNGSGVRHQSMSGPPVQELVTVAVLPPRLPSDMAAPTGLGPAEAFSWDESINWSHNQKINQPEPTSSKKFMRKIGLTTQRQKATDKPPFIFRKVPYDVWRKHYAKDQAGRYKGTDTPAEDCLLLPEDVERWRLEAPQTKADLWTRGKQALPGYGADFDAAPAYSETAPAYLETAPPVDSRNLSSASAEAPQPHPHPRSESNFTADGRTTEQIIQAAREKAEQKKKEKGGWKNTLKRGTEFALLAS